jgi:hypothetical protein
MEAEHILRMLRLAAMAIEVYSPERLLVPNTQFQLDSFSDADAVFHFR